MAKRKHSKWHSITSPAFEKAEAKVIATLKTEIGHLERKLKPLRAELFAREQALKKRLKHRIKGLQIFCEEIKVVGLA